MKKLVLSDILPPKLYEPVRDDMRRRVIALKKHRRVDLGELVTVTFENRQTMILQVEEMARAEHLDDPVKLQHEIDVYNTLLPDEGQLSATLFIAVTEEAQIRPTLSKLVGIDEHVSLRIGEHTIRAEFEPGRSEADRVSSVQYVRFTLPAAAREALRTSGTRVELIVDHPDYGASTVLADDTRASLAADLD